MASCPWADCVLHKRNKRFLAFEEKLPEALDLMVSAIRAGHGFASAINHAARGKHANPFPASSGSVATSRISVLTCESR